MSIYAVVPVCCVCVCRVCVSCVCHVCVVCDGAALMSVSCLRMAAHVCLCRVSARTGSEEIMKGARLRYMYVVNSLHTLEAYLWERE